MTTTDPTVAAPQPAEALDLDGIADSATGWDRDWIAQLPGYLPSSTYLVPDLAGRAQREITALLADVDRLVAEVRRLRADLVVLGADRDILDQQVSAHEGELGDMRAQMSAAEAEVDRLRAELDAASAAPTTFALPAEPPPEVTELWDRNDDRWTPDGDDAHKGYRFWRRERDGWVAHYPTVLDHCGPLSTTAPAGTEGER